MSVRGQYVYISRYSSPAPSLQNICKLPISQSSRPPRGIAAGLQGPASASGCGYSAFRGRMREPASYTAVGRYAPIRCWDSIAKPPEKSTNNSESGRSIQSHRFAIDSPPFSLYCTYFRHERRAASPVSRTLSSERPRRYLRARL